MTSILYILSIVWLVVFLIGSFSVIKAGEDIELWTAIPTGAATAFLLYQFFV